VVVKRASGKLAPHREALLLRHADLVKRIAYHLFQRRNYVDVDDLIQVGMGGLRAAIVGYGHDAARSFEANASVCIREAMLEFVRNSDWSLRSPSGACHESKT
jgi:RNA polymerase sigma factor for flagellar operon FliA